MANRTEMEFLLEMGAKMSSSYQAVMKAAASGLKGVGKAAQDASTASGKLRATIADQEAKLSAVREKYIDSALATGKHSKQTKALQKEYEKLSKELKKSKKNLSDAGKGLDDLDKKSEKAEKSVTAMTVALGNIAAKGFTSLVGGAKNAISSLAGLSSSTRDYRTSVIRLNAAMQQNGYSAEFTQSAYDDLYRYIGNSETVSNVITTFASLNTEQTTMQELLEGLTGAWAAMGGSVPIETLSESIEETVKSGKVTGELTNALRRAGISENTFNQQLKRCKTTEERAQLVADTLNATMGDQKSAYDEAAKSILDANDAQNDYEKAQASLGEKIEPVTTSLQSGWAQVQQSFADNIVAGIDMDSFTSKIDTAFGWVANTAIPWVSNGIAALPQFFVDAKNNINTAVNGMKNKIESVWNAITGFFTGAGEKITAFASGAWDTAVGLFSGPVEAVRKDIGDKWDAIKGFFSGASTIISGIATGDWETAVNGFGDVGESLRTYWEEKWNDIKGIFTGVISWVNDTFNIDVGKAFGNIASTMSDKFGAVGDLIKVPINAVITALNWIIDKVNNIAITLPDWGILGGLAGQTFGVHIDPIPELAEGGIATSPTLAMIGEGKGPEAVIPLDKLDRLMNTSPSVNYAPVINISGGDAAQIKGALADNYQQFVQFMQQYQRQQRRTVFAGN